MLALFKQESAVPVGCRSPARLLAGGGDDAFFFAKLLATALPTCSRHSIEIRSAYRLDYTHVCYVHTLIQIKHEMARRRSPRSALDPSHPTLRSGPSPHAFGTPCCRSMPFPRHGVWERDRPRWLLPYGSP